MLELFFAAIFAMVATHGRVEGPIHAIYAGGPWGTDQKSEGIAGAAITPGAAVVSAATDGNIQEAAAGATKSTFLGIAAENVRWDADDFFTDHPINEAAQYYAKQATEVFALIVPGSAALVYGNRLKVGAGGALEKFVEGTDNENLAVAKYIGRADYSPPGTGTPRALCVIGGGA